MAKNEKIKNSNKEYPDRTLSDEQIKKMSSDDMILTTYQCQYVDKESSEKVAHQLLRILLRIVNHHSIEMNQLWYKVELGNLEQLRLNEIISEEEWESEQKRLIEVWKPSKNFKDN